MKLEVAVGGWRAVEITTSKQISRIFWASVFVFTMNLWLEYELTNIVWCEHGLSLNRIIVSLESANCGCIILSEWWMQWNVTCKYEMKWGRDKNTYGGKDEKWMNSIVSLVRVILSFIYVAGTRDRLGYYYNMHDMNMQIQYLPLAS